MHFCFRLDFQCKSLNIVISGWFHVVQAMMCLSLLGQLLSLIFTLIYVVATALPKKKKVLITAAFTSIIFAGECLRIIDVNLCRRHN